MSLDPAEQNRRYEEVKVRVEQAMKEGEIGEAMRRFGWLKYDMLFPPHRSHRFYYEYEGRREALEQKIEREISHADERLEISNQSSAFEQRVVAGVVTARSEVGDRRYAHGVHAIGGNLVRALVPPEKLFLQPLDPRFSPQRGEVFVSTSVHLVNRMGPMVGVDTEPLKGDQAVAILAKELAKDTPYTEVTDQLPFLEENRRLLHYDIPSLRARSQHVLPDPGIDLEDWYGKKLIALGGLCSVKEVVEHAADMTLTLSQLYPEPAQQELIARTERDYPTRFALGDREFGVEYEYDPKKTPPLVALVKLWTTDATDFFLTLRPQDVPQMGPQDHPLPITWSMHVGRTALEGTDIIELQEQLDPDFLSHEWKKYEFAGYAEPLVITPADTFPDTITPQRTFPPYATDRRGITHSPVPAIMHVKQDEYAVVLRKNAPEAEATVGRAKSTHEQAVREAARQAKLQVEGPALAEKATKQLEAFLARDAEDRKDEVTAMVYRMRGVNNSFDQAAIRQAIASGNPDQALTLLAHLEQRREWNQPLIKIIQKGLALVKKIVIHQAGQLKFPAGPAISMLNPERQVLSPDHFLPDRYGQHNTYEKLPEVDYFAAMIPVLEAEWAKQEAWQKALQAEALAAEAEHQRQKAEFLAMPPAEQLKRIQQIDLRVEPMVSQVTRVLNGQARKNIPQRRQWFVTEELYRLRQKYEVQNLLHAKEDIDKRRAVVVANPDPAQALGVMERLGDVFYYYSELVRREETLLRYWQAVKKDIQVIERDVEPKAT